MKQIILAFTYVHEGSFYFWQATYSAPVIFVYIWFVMNVFFLTSFYATFQCFFCPPKHKKTMRREVNKLDIKIRRLIFGTDFKDCHVCKKSLNCAVQFLTHSQAHQIPPTCIGLLSSLNWHYCSSFFQYPVMSARYLNFGANIFTHVDSLCILVKKTNMLYTKVF